MLYLILLSVYHFWAFIFFNSQKRIDYKTRGRERNWSIVSENMILQGHERYAVI